MTTPRFNYNPALYQPCNNNTKINNIEFSYYVSGTILSMTDSMATLVGDSESTSKNIYQLLESSSNCDSSIISEIKHQISEKKSIIDVILKFKRLPTPVLLSFLQVNYLNIGKEPIISCIGREVTLPANFNMLFQSSRLTQCSIAKIIERLNSGKIRLSDKERSIMFLLSSGFAQDKIAKMLGYSRGYIATLISRELCPKFGIVGSSTVLLTEIAVSIRDFHRQIPKMVEETFRAVIL